LKTSQHFSYKYHATVKKWRDVGEELKKTRESKKEKTLNLKPFLLQSPPFETKSVAPPFEKTKASFSLFPTKTLLLNYSPSPKHRLTLNQSQPASSLFWLSPPSPRHLPLVARPTSPAR